jgi:hypothetical protein
LSGGSFQLSHTNLSDENMTKSYDLTLRHQLSEDVTAAKAPHVFPTRYRDKQSHLLSYPVGAGILSRTLDGVPQHQHFTCWFSAGDHIRQRHATQLAVLTIAYRRRRITQSDPRNALALGRLAPSWSISVYGVLRQHRHLVRVVLVDRILPGPVRQWLISEAPEHGAFAACDITFSVEIDTGDVTRGWPRT